MPRHLTVYCERMLCERVAPGARVTVLGIYSIKKISKIGVTHYLSYLTLDIPFSFIYNELQYFLYLRFFFTVLL